MARYRSFSLLLVFLMLLAACAPAAVESPPAAPAAEEQAPAQATEAPAAPETKDGGTITVAMRSEPPNLDPHASEAWYAFEVEMHLFDNLVVIDPDSLEFKPVLAESWEMSDDGMTWTFKLREDVKFHDGTPLNAEAVAFSFNRIIDPELNSPAAAPLMGGNLQSAEVVDEFTVRFILNNPFAGFLDALAAGYGGVVPVSPAAVEQWGEDFGQHPVGTGPFMFKEWIPKDRIVLVRNPDYNWGSTAVYETPGPAHVDELVYLIVPEATSRTAMLQTGDADALITVNEPDIESLRADGHQIVEGRRPGTSSMIQFNTERPPTDDINVRMAIMHALDMEEVMELVYSGYRPTAFGPLQPKTFGYNPAADNYYPKDLDKARQILDDAGWTLGADGIREKDGQKLNLIWICFPGQHCQQGEVLQAQVRDLGVEVEIREMGQPANVQATQRGEHNIRTIGWGGTDASQLLSFLYHSSNIGSGWNFTRFKSAELDEMLDNAVSEVDPQTRKKMIEDIQIFVMENALSAPVNYYYYPFAVQKDLKGVFAEYASAQLMFKDAYWDR